jgi:hypothetical protein
MRGRIGELIPPALLGSLLLALFPGTVRAHRLKIDYRVLPDHKIQVEGWYNSPGNPHPAAQAKVQVRRGDGSTLTAGELDADGFFTFAYDRAEALTVIISQTGHREEETIPAEKLGGGEGSAAPNETADKHHAGGHDHSMREFVHEVLVGVGFLLALAAFVMSLRNARTLARMEKNSTRRDDVTPGSGTPRSAAPPTDPDRH